LKGFLKGNKEVNIIGIDRGERNLAYYSVINQKGEILEQGSFNKITANGREFDYFVKLDELEKEG
jgi:CRISPR-associated protein Cpf1